MPSPEQPGAPERPALRRGALLALAPRVRRGALLALTALAVPLATTAYDVITRGAIFPYLLPRKRAMYVEGAVLGLVLWSLGMEAARHPKRGVRAVALALLGVTAAFGFGGQAYFRGLSNEYLSREAVLLAADVPGMFTGYVGEHAPLITATLAIPALLMIGVAVARRRRFGVARGRWWPNLAAVAATGALLAAIFSRAEPGFLQCLPPDMLFLHAIGGAISAAAGHDTKLPLLPIGRHEGLPPAPAVAADAPSIVVILRESIRRDEVCTNLTPGCTRSPAVDAAAPDRIGYARAFSIASCTELASTVLWSGLAINAEVDALGRAPLLWDYARARGYRTAYLTSQNLAYQHLGLFLRASRIDLQREARDRLANAPLDVGSPDELLVAEAADFVEKGGPSLVLVHLANSHVPYRQVPGFTPHTAADSGDHVRAAYRNSVLHDDVVVGDLVARLRRGAVGRSAVVVALSDHGEAWSEHHVVGHTFDVFSEQIDIPLWIDAPAGSLSPAAIERLRADAPSRPVSTADVSATVIDLLGALDEPAFRLHTASLAGSSLLRAPPGPRDVLLWNCPPSRLCLADAFGVIAWPMKLHYVGREFHYECHDIEADPEEKSPLPQERCGAQRALLDRIFLPHIEVTPR
jgi:glucan phosphoethanolaminetransferase (alkaline phosphatase superfamily)